MSKKNGEVMSPELRKICRMYKDGYSINRIATILDRGRHTIASHLARLNIHKIGIHNRDKTHCPQGHEYTRENTYLGIDGNRDCRICDLQRQRNRRIRGRSSWLPERELP